MVAYVVSHVTVDDASKFEAYLDAVPVVLQRHGVEYVVRGGRPEALEGDWKPERIVVLRFRDRAHVRQWYESPEYQHLVELRQGAARVSAIIVDGYETESGR